MLIRALKVLALVATMVSCAYAVIGFHSSGDRSTVLAQNGREGTTQAILPERNPVRSNDTKPVGANSGIIIGPGARIEQNSSRDNSPNIVSGGNVSIQSK
jgi:hypothetical protein